MATGPGNIKSIKYRISKGTSKVSLEHPFDSSIACALYNRDGMQVFCSGPVVLERKKISLDFGEPTKFPITLTIWG